MCIVAILLFFKLLLIACKQDLDDFWDHLLCCICQTRSRDWDHLQQIFWFRKRMSIVAKKSTFVKIVLQKFFTEHPPLWTSFFAFFTDLFKNFHDFRPRLYFIVCRVIFFQDPLDIAPGQFWQVSGTCWKCQKWPSEASRSEGVNPLQKQKHPFFCVRPDPQCKMPKMQISVGFCKIQ